MSKFFIVFTSILLFLNGIFFMTNLYKKDKVGIIVWLLFAIINIISLYIHVNNLLLKAQEEQLKRDIENLGG